MSLLDGSAIKSAQPFSDERGHSVLITLTEMGAKQFAELTTKNRERRMAIVIAGKVLSAPVIKEAILGGTVMISGNFSKEDAADLADKLTRHAAR